MEDDNLKFLTPLLILILIMSFVGISGCIGNTEYSVGDSKFQLPSGWVKNESANFLVEFTNGNVTLQILQRSIQNEFNEEYNRNLVATSNDSALYNNTTIEGADVKEIYYMSTGDVFYDYYFFQKNGKYYIVYFIDRSPNTTNSDIIPDAIDMIIKTIN